MPCPQLKTCCCCCTTETGTKIIGWLQTICCIIATLVAVFALVLSITHLNKPVKYEMVKYGNGSFINETVSVSTTVEDVAYSATSLVIYLLMAILGIYLLVGVYKRNMSYVRLWVVCSTVLLCVSLAIILIRIIMYIAGKDVEGGDIAQSVITTLFEAYFILVVHSFYREGKSNTGGNF
ncbi:hypothetical protein O3M35_011740 [Rhynocoris fuscipes]|uniref:Uncharacterized protein n=1 Tax=Rhynocoris fuscipes TaxID=488301 RepID=A0AAW1CZK5_9HEMI